MIKGWPLFTTPAGEAAKSLKTYEKVISDLIDFGLDKKSCLIAIGGGALLDLANFVAATYLRGVSLIMIPTTLLAMVDASCGGKAALNVLAYKNLVGTINHPQKVFIDPFFLHSLLPSEFKNGFAEIIKHALIKSLALYQKLKQGFRSCCFEISDLIYESVQIKCQVVSADPTEKNLRKILNFGHTFGHAVEAASQHKISHGQAVAIGMVAESWISHQLGFLSFADLEEIIELIWQYEFDLMLLQNLDELAFKKAIVLDKKNEKGEIYIVVLEKIGATASAEGKFCQPVSEKLIMQSFNWIRDDLRSRHRPI